MGNNASAFSSLTDLYMNPLQVICKGVSHFLTAREHYFHQIQLKIAVLDQMKVSPFRMGPNALFRNA